MSLLSTHKTFEGAELNTEDKVETAKNRRRIKTGLDPHPLNFESEIINSLNCLTVEWLNWEKKENPRLQDLSLVFASV